MHSFRLYQELASKTLNKSLTGRELVSMLSMGLAGETGELVDELKKILYHDKKMDTDIIIKELGDVLWYLTMLCTAFGLNIENVAGENIEKLNRRHGDSFKTHDEQKRE